MSDEKYYKMISESKLPAHIKLAFLEYIEWEKDESRKKQTADKFLDFSRVYILDEQKFSEKIIKGENSFKDAKQHALTDLLYHIKLIEAELSELGNDSQISKLRKSIQNIN